MTIAAGTNHAEAPIWETLENAGTFEGATFSYSPDLILERSQTNGSGCPAADPKRAVPRSWPVNPLSACQSWRDQPSPFWPDSATMAPQSAQLLEQEASRSSGSVRRRRLSLSGRRSRHVFAESRKRERIDSDAAGGLLGGVPAGNPIAGGVYPTRPRACFLRPLLAWSHALCSGIESPKELGRAPLPSDGSRVNRTSCCTPRGSRLQQRHLLVISALFFPSFFLIKVGHTSLMNQRKWNSMICYVAMMSVSS